MKYSVYVGHEPKNLGNFGSGFIWIYVLFYFFFLCEMQHYRETYQQIIMQFSGYFEHVARKFGRTVWAFQITKERLHAGLMLICWFADLLYC